MVVHKRGSFFQTYHSGMFFVSFYSTKEYSCGSLFKTEQYLEVHQALEILLPVGPKVFTLADETFLGQPQTMGQPKKKRGKSQHPTGNPRWGPTQNRPETLFFPFLNEYNGRKRCVIKKVLALLFFFICTKEETKNLISIVSWIVQGAPRKKAPQDFITQNRHASLKLHNPNTVGKLNKFLIKWRIERQNPSDRSEVIGVQIWSTENASKQGCVDLFFGIFSFLLGFVIRLGHVDSR